MNGDHANTIDGSYLSWSNSLRADLQALGLERRTRPVQSLQEYLADYDAKNTTDDCTPSEGTRADRND